MEGNITDEVTLSLICDATQPRRSVPVPDCSVCVPVFVLIDIWSSPRSDDVLVTVPYDILVRYES